MFSEIKNFFTILTNVLVLHLFSNCLLFNKLFNHQFTKTFRHSILRVLLNFPTSFSFVKTAKCLRDSSKDYWTKSSSKYKHATFPIVHRTIRQINFLHKKLCLPGKSVRFLRELLYRV